MTISTIGPAAIDEARVEEFAARVVGDGSAAVTTVLSSIGDRVGLWAALASGGPATSEELAAWAGLIERYVREWCAAMTSAGYIDYDPASGRFSLPPEHAVVLVDDSTPAYLGGSAQLTRGMIEAADGVEAAFRHGGGVPIEEYGEHFWNGLSRVTGTYYDHLLVQEWIPAVDGLDQRLRDGALVADVGCGLGRALINMAAAYPNSRFHGYDVAPEAVARARAAVEEAGLSDRIEIRQHDGGTGLPERYDLITTFDVVHDSRDPRGLLSSIRGALREDGVYMCLDIASHEQLEDNAGPLGTLMFGYSVLHCMTTSLAQDGAGLGTCGVHEGRLRELSLEAGFTSVTRFAEDPFSHVYELRP